MVNTNNNVFIGEEILFRKLIGLTFESWYDPRVVPLMGLIRDSGIEREWLTIADRKKTSLLDSVHPDKLSLQGNILVLFSLFGIGACLATFCFAIEVRNLLLRCFTRVGRKVTALVVVGCFGFFKLTSKKLCAIKSRLLLLIVRR